MKRMTIDEAIKLLLIERECVDRNEHHILCDRNCEKCDLVQDADKIIEMYSNVIQWLEELKELKREEYDNTPIPTYGLYSYWL